MVSGPPTRYSSIVSVARRVIVICGSRSGSLAISGGIGGGSGKGTSFAGGDFCAVAVRATAKRSADKRAVMRRRMLLVRTSGHVYSNRNRFCDAGISVSSQVQHLVALGACRLKTATFIIVENCFDDCLGLFDDPHQVEVARGNHAFTDQLVLHPGDQSLPEFAPDQNDRYLAALSGLDQRQALGQLVDRAKASRQHYVGRRKTHEHHLAREEIAKVDPNILEAVATLLVTKN